MNTELNLIEYRCMLSKKLLCKACGDGQIEIMNPENRFINYVGPSRKHQDIGPKGQAFQTFAVDLRCKECGRLQCRAVGTDLKVEVKCRYCHNLNLFDLEEIQRLRNDTLSTRQQANLNNLKKTI